MKKILFASLAALTAMTAAPALAAPGDYDRSGYTQRGDDRLLGGDRNDSRGDVRDYGRDYGRNDNGFRDGRGGDARSELFRLDAMIDRGMQSGSINWREARMFKSDLRDLREMQAHLWRTGGVNYRERAILDRRIDNLRTAIWRESNDRGGRDRGGWR